MYNKIRIIGINRMQNVDLVGTEGKGPIIYRFNSH